MNNETSHKPPQHTQGQSTNFGWVRDIVLGLISAAQTPSAHFVTMAAGPESISPLDKTPTTSNSRPTPPEDRERAAASTAAALRRIRFQEPYVETMFENPGDELSSDEDDDVMLTQILDDSELERLYELGYDSDGELAPYLSS